MTVIQLQWEWDAATLVTMLGDGYDQQKVEWEDPVGNPGIWVEATRATTRLPLVDPVQRYLWEGSSDMAYNFRATPYRTSDQTDGTPFDITNNGTQKVRGYATIAEMRDEGYQPTAHTDARVQASLDLAMDVIDRVCGQRFDPYWAKFILDIPKPYDEAMLDVPIAALWQLNDARGTIDLSQGAIIVSNRHLTLGMIHPDDRKDPRLQWSDAGAYATRRVETGRFVLGRRGLTIVGVFGFTEIGSTDEAGEVVADSQVPISYGSTPAEINRACMKLAGKYLYKISSGISEEMSMASRVISERTRDQSYTLSAGASISSDTTGDPEVDDILAGYAAPLSLGSV
jgi:hypothetical protein